MRVVLLVDDDAIEPDDPQFLRLHRSAADDNTFVARALRRLGHQVVPVAFGGNIEDMLRQLDAARPDVVFNSTDSIGDDRTKAAHIAAFLELAGYPYTGCGPFALSLSTDKARSKQVLSSHRVPVPSFFIVSPGEVPPRAAALPIFVKPLFGGAKECVSLDSAVYTSAALEKRVRFVHRVARQAALCESYVDGRELTVGVIETGAGLRVFPVREMVFGGSNGSGPRFATHRVMEDKAYRRRWNVTMRNARLPRAQIDAIQSSARIAFRALDFRGYGRLDLRLGTDGIAYVLEVNANPALRPRSHSFIAPWVGIAYEELIATVLETARRAST